MSDADYPYKMGEFFIDIHNIKGITTRKWAILQSVGKYGNKLFDVYKTKEQAEQSAKFYGLTIIDKPN